MAYPKNQNKKAAKHEANQEALDRLWTKYDQVSQIPGSKFGHTVKRAIKSVQACETPISSVKEAKALHGVGDSLARVICKIKKAAQPALSRESSVSSGAASKSSAAARKAPPPPPPKSDGLKSEAPKVSEKEKAHIKAVKASESLVLPSKDWKVVLLVDGRERGWKKVIAKLQMSGVPSEKRNLPIGDMVWVAKSTVDDVEVMLGTIVERKEVHDLTSSLFGTRYKEQRLRLQHCGVEQVFLLVEGDTKDVSNCPHETLQMAMMETRVQLDFQVVQTRHLEDTVRFLKSVHRRILQRTFPSAFGAITASLPSFSSPGASRRRRRRSIQKRDKNDRRSFDEMIFDTPPEPPFGAKRFITYNELKCKVEMDREQGTKTVNAIFCGMLKQITKISNVTIPPLVHAYPTPDALFRALDGLNVSEGKSLLADLEAGSKKVGEQKALEVYYAFMCGADDSIAISNPPEETSKKPAAAKSPPAATLPTIKETQAASKPKPAKKPAAGQKRKPQPPNDAKPSPKPAKRPTIERRYSPPSDIIEVLDSPTPSQPAVPSQLSQDSWEQWDADQQWDADPPANPSASSAASTKRVVPDDSSQSNVNRRAASESIDSLDAFVFPQSPNSNSSPEYRRPLAARFQQDTSAKRPSPASSQQDSPPSARRKKTARKSRASIDSIDLLEARMHARKKAAPPVNLSQSSSSTFGSPPAEPLAVRIRRMRERLRATAAEASPQSPQRSPVVREVSLSEDDNSPPAAVKRQPEVIDLID